MASPRYIQLRGDGVPFLLEQKIPSAAGNLLPTSRRLSWLPDRRLFAESLLLNYLPRMETAFTLLAGLIVIEAENLRFGHGYQVEPSRRWIGL